MEKLKLKHNHKWTDILKVGIFALVLLAPIGAVATKCLYAIVNKNAYQSYSSEMINTTENITNATQIQQGDLITWNYKEGQATATTDTAIVYFTSLSFNPTDYGFNDLEYDRISLSSRTSSQLVFLYSGNNYYFKDIWGTQLTTITIRVGTGTTGSLINNNAICYKTTYTTEKLDNVFYYSVNELTTNQMFNWTMNTGIYTGINAMFTGLDMPSGNPLAVLLTYWMLMILIYIVFDIIIVLLVKMSHFFQE